MGAATVDVVCGYALELVLSGLRGVRGFIGRLVGGDESLPLHAVPPPQPNDGGTRLRRELEQPTPLPDAYRDDRLVLLARDPRTLFAYWDLTPWSERPPNATDDGLVLRIEDLTLLDFDRLGPSRHRDVAVDRLVGSVYVEIEHAAGTFRAEIGWRCADGTFAPRARSEVVTAPRDATPGHAPLRWLTVHLQTPTAAGTTTLATAPAPSPANAVARSAPSVNGSTATSPGGRERTSADTPGEERRRAPSSEEPYRRGR